MKHLGTLFAFRPCDMNYNTQGEKAVHTSDGARSVKKSGDKTIRRALLTGLVSLAMVLCAGPVAWAGGSGGMGGTAVVEDASAGGTGSDGSSTNANGAQGGATQDGQHVTGTPGAAGNDGDGLATSVDGGGGNEISSPYSRGPGGVNGATLAVGGEGGALGKAIDDANSTIDKAVDGAGGTFGAAGSDLGAFGSTGGGGGGDGVIFNGDGTLTVNKQIHAGAGGDGGNATSISLGSGGGGGGGAGLVATSASTLNILSSVSGGNGGGGGSAIADGLNGGGGGGGGVGLAASNSTVDVEAAGSVYGGNGGLAGTGGNSGEGGVGILGSSLNVTVAGIVEGGYSGDSTSQADAIHFIGGVNQLTLQKGYSITGNVVANGTSNTLVLGGSDNATFNVGSVGSSAQYQGFDKFEKTGTSTWTLTGTGAQDWTVNAGTLVGNADSLQGKIKNDATVVFNMASSDGTYSNVISGSGAVVKNGPYILTLSGPNTYAGGTTIKGGNLDVEGSGSLGTGDVTNNAVLVFTDHTSAGGAHITTTSAGTTDFARNSVTGAAQIDIVGGGSLNFYDNASADGATINASGGSSVNLYDNALAGAANITLNNGVLLFLGASSANNSVIDATDSTIYFFQDTAADGASITLRGSSDLDLSARTTTTLSIGSLQGEGTVHLSRANLVVGSSNSNTTFAGIIEDGGLLGGTGGSLTKVGTGTLTLDGINTYTGATLVKAGTLIVGSDVAHSNASITSNVQVASGATIGGHGSIGGLTVAGTVAPGNSIGTLTVNGDYTSEPGSTYDAEIDAAGGHDLINVTGHATLNGGTVNVEAATGTYSPSATYTLLTADGGVSGKYDSLTSNLAFLNPMLTYDPDDVILGFQRNTVAFPDVANTSNEQAAAAGVESLGSGSALYDGIVGLDAQDARNAFNATSGELYASTQSALLEDSRYVRDAVSDRLSLGCINARNEHTDDQACGHSIWARAYGNWGHTAGDGNAARMDHDASGILIGADTGVHDWRVGALVGYNHGHSSVDARSSSGSNDSYQVGAYAGTRKGHLNLNVGAAYAWHDIDNHRNVAFTGYNDSVSGSYNANTAQLFGEVGYDVDYGRTTLTPFARAAYIHLNTDSFTESGGTAALRGSGKNTDQTVSTLGVRLSSMIKHTGATTVRAHGLAGWRHAYGSTTPEADLSFDGGDQFTVAGVPVARNALVVSAGVDLQVKRNLSVGASYVGQFGGGVQSNGIRLSIMRHF